MFANGAFVIDDDRNFRLRVASSLRRDGFRVRTFSTARTALTRLARLLARTLSRAPRRLVLMNVHLSDIAGLKLLTGMRDVFIVVTSLRDSSSRVRATDLGKLTLEGAGDANVLTNTLKRFWCGDVDHSIAGAFANG